MTTISRSFFSILLFSVVLLTSCGKEKIALPWEELNSGVSSELNGVHFTDALHGHIVGGDSWLRGLYLETFDGGSSWQVDTFSFKQLYGMHFTPEGLGHAVGIDGFLFEKDSPAETWEFRRLPRWDILRDVAFYDEDHGVAVGGIAFSTGATMTISQNYIVSASDTFPNELSAVAFSDVNTVHAVGYGIVLRSTDSGATWKYSETSGDYFRDIQFPSETTGYVVGYNGTILKTTDAGVNWKKIRKGDAINVSDVPFRCLHFTNTQKGYLAGDDGTLWRTLDGGDNWQIITDLPKANFTDIHLIDDRGYLVTDDGRIFRFEEE